MNLKLDWCSYDAADYAVKRWHYSRSMPAGKTIKIGVWENDRFIGCIIYSRGASNNLLKPYGLAVTEGCELTRIALDTHETPVSRLISISLRMLKKLCPGMRLVISFADDRQKHTGAVYQASNWIYTGTMHTTEDYFLRGRWMHVRTVNKIFKSINNIPKDTPKRDGGLRIRYVMPLDDAMRAQIAPLAKPFPKRVKQAIDPFPGNSGGVAPTHTLQISQINQISNIVEIDIGPPIQKPKPFYAISIYGGLENVKFVADNQRRIIEQLKIIDYLEIIPEVMAFDNIGDCAKVCCALMEMKPSLNLRVASSEEINDSGIIH